jgi:hypothetical protein
MSRVVRTVARMVVMAVFNLMISMVIVSAGRQHLAASVSGVCGLVGVTELTQPATRAAACVLHHVDIHA